MDLRLASEPLTQNDKLGVVTLEEVKRAARVTTSAWDADIKDDIEAAYDHLAGPNGWLGGCSLLTEQWELYLPAPASDRIELPMRPVRVDDVSGLDYLAADGSYLVLDPTRYGVLASPDTFTLVARGGQPWPYVAPGSPLGFRLRFTAGFGIAKADIPSPIRKAIRLLAAHWADARSATSAEGRAVGQQIEFGVRALCGRYRISPDHS